MRAGPPRGADAELDGYYQQLAYHITFIIEYAEDAIVLGLTRTQFHQNCHCEPSAAILLLKEPSSASEIATSLRSSR